MTQILKKRPTVALASVSSNLPAPQRRQTNWLASGARRRRTGWVGEGGRGGGGLPGGQELSGQVW